MKELTQEAKELIKAVEDKKSATQELIDQGLSPEKVKAMQVYAFQLHRKFPKMAPNRIKQRVAKKFNLKIV